MNLSSDKPDKLDLRILNELRLDGRIANADLAARVGLSESACLRRVRRGAYQHFVEFDDLPQRLREHMTDDVAPLKRIRSFTNVLAEEGDDALHAGGIYDGRQRGATAPSGSAFNSARASRHDG